MQRWFYNLQMRNKIFIGNGIAILVLIIFSINIFFTIDQMQETSKLVIHTEKVIATGHNLLEQVLNLETGERGFIITGNDDFLEPYEHSHETFDQKILLAKNLVSDNPNQVARLKEIDLLVQK